MRTSPLRLPARVLAVVALVATACGTDGSTSRRVIASPIPGGDVLEVPAESPTPEPTPRSRSAARVGVAPRDDPRSGSRLSNANARVVQIASLNAPLAMTVRPGSDESWIAEKGGRVRILVDDAVRAGAALDLSDEVSGGGEQGLLGIAFSPDGSFFYVHFTDDEGDTVIREYALEDDGGVDEQSARDVLTVDQPFSNHNGGNLVFGPDRYLWIGLGDGGSGQPNDNAQDPESLLGKMLRIDPRPGALDEYTIPPDNPFVGRAGRDEIWALGLRNPWRYSFDRASGDLYIGDVGQNSWEEIDWEPSDHAGGANYGWDRLEGTHRFKGSPPDEHRLPIYEYPHDGGNCSVTGGFVYRGDDIPDLRGAYVFVDLCVGQLRAFVPEDGKALEHRLLGVQVPRVSSFGEDADGELYVLSVSGGVYRIEQA